MIYNQRVTGVIFPFHIRGYGHSCFFVASWPENPSEIGVIIQLRYRKPWPQLVCLEAFPLVAGGGLQLARRLTCHVHPHQ